jgi:transcriptional regulator with XRE-family HTH domain
MSGKKSRDEVRRLHGEQLRAARALLGWSQQQLAEASTVSLATIRRAEKVDGPLVSMTEANADAIRRACEEREIIFVEEDDGSRIGAAIRRPKT